MAKEYKNNIFSVLNKIDNKKYNYYEELSEDNKKEIQPYTLLRWASCVDNKDEINHELYTLEMNEYVNKNFWVLSKHKNLQWKLLCSGGQNKFMKHKWIAPKKETVDKMMNIVRQFYPNLSDEEINIKYNNMTEDEKQSILEYIGLK